MFLGKSVGKGARKTALSRKRVIEIDDDMTDDDDDDAMGEEPALKKRKRETSSGTHSDSKGRNALVSAFGELAEVASLRADAATKAAEQARLLATASKKEVRAWEALKEAAKAWAKSAAGGETRAKRAL
jgi:hypothetical protein